MYRVAAVTLRVPVPGDVGLHLAGLVGCPNPELIIAVGGQSHGGGPAHPVEAITRRPPWMFGSGSPFMAQTMSPCFSIAFEIGMPRESASWLGLPER